MSASSLISWLSDRVDLSRGGEIPKCRLKEGLRGLAVLVVLPDHFDRRSARRQAPGTASTVRVPAAHTVRSVDVNRFFALCGFVSDGTLIKRTQPFLRCMQRRVRRASPTLLGALTICLGLSLLMPQHGRLTDGAAVNAVYVLQNILLLVGKLPLQSFGDVVWAPGDGMSCGLAILILIFLAGLGGHSRAARCCFFAVLWVGGSLRAAAYGLPDLLSGFMLGVVLHELMRLLPGSRPWPTLNKSPRMRRISIRDVPQGAILSHGQAMARTYNAAERARQGAARREGLVQRCPCGVWVGLALAAAAAALLTPVLGAPLQASDTVTLGLALALLCLAYVRQRLAAMARVFSHLPLRRIGNMGHLQCLRHGQALLSLASGCTLLFPASWLPARERPLTLSICSSPAALWPAGRDRRG